MAFEPMTVQYTIRFSLEQEAAETSARFCYGKVVKIYRDKAETGIRLAMPTTPTGGYWTVQFEVEVADTAAFKQETARVSAIATKFRGTFITNRVVAIATKEE